MPRNSVAYDDDFFAWTQEQARLLRAGEFSQLDIENLAEEIESLGRSVRRELRRRAADVLTQLLKWQYQPAFRSDSWRSAMGRRRRAISELIGESPSLRSEIRSELTDIYRSAVLGAVAEIGLLGDSFPKLCPYTPAQILSEDFLPE